MPATTITTAARVRASAPRQEPVDAGDADVGQPRDVLPERSGGHRRFLGDRQIARPGGHDQDRSDATGWRPRLAPGRRTVAPTR